MTKGRETEPTLERYRGYLYVVARLRVGQGLRGKLDPSDLVQQTLLKAHQAADRWKSVAEEARGGWLRQILANTIVDEVRRYGRARRDASLERSLLASLEESSIRLEAWLEADQSSPSQHAIRQEQLVALGRRWRRCPRTSVGRSSCTISTAIRWPRWRSGWVGAKPRWRGSSAGDSRSLHQRMTRE